MYNALIQTSVTITLSAQHLLLKKKQERCRQCRLRCAVAFCVWEVPPAAAAAAAAAAVDHLHKKSTIGKDHSCLTLPGCSVPLLSVDSYVCVDV